MNSFFSSCEYKADKTKIQHLVEAAPAILELHDMYGRSPLHWECAILSFCQEKRKSCRIL